MLYKECSRYLIGGFRKSNVYVYVCYLFWNSLANNSLNILLMFTGYRWSRVKTICDKSKCITYYVPGSAIYEYTMSYCSFSGWSVWCSNFRLHNIAQFFIVPLCIKMMSLWDSFLLIVDWERYRENRFYNWYDIKVFVIREKTGKMSCTVFGFDKGYFLSGLM